MNEELSVEEKKLLEDRKERLLEETKKKIDMLVDQYAIAYSTKDKEAKFVDRYLDTIRGIKNNIITYDTRFSNFIIGSNILSREEKINIYKEKEKSLGTFTDEGIDKILAEHDNLRNNSELLFSVRAEKIIREYFNKASGTGFNEFEAQCVKLEAMFLVRKNNYVQEKGLNLKEQTNFDPKQEIQAKYKQLNKLEEKDKLRRQLKEELKEQLVQYFTEQSKKQKSFYDVEDSKIFKEFNIIDMTPVFKKKTEKLPVNLENLETKELETKKNKLKKELKQVLKEPLDESAPKRLVLSTELEKRNKLEELTFLREELRVRKELKQAKKHFDIKLSKIFGEETAQVKKEFHDLLRSEDSLAKALKIVQKAFPETYKHNPEKTKVVQQSLAAQIETASAISEKNKPEEKSANLQVNYQNTVPEKLTQRNEHLRNLENQTDRIMGNAQDFREVTKRLKQSNRGLLGIRQLIKPRKQVTPVTRTNEQNQEDKHSRNPSQQSEVSATRSNSITSNIQTEQASTTQKESKGINFPRFPQANWNRWMVRFPGLRQLVKPMNRTTTATTEAGKQNKADTFSHNFEQQKAASIKSSNNLNTNIQKSQPATVSRGR